MISEGDEPEKKDEDTIKSLFSEIELLVCPSCNSYNSYCDSQSDELRACGCCYAIFWTADCDRKHMIYSMPTGMESTADYIEVIDKGMGNTVKKETCLREELWWKLNDIMRDNPDDTSFSVEQEELFNSNLGRLLELIDEATTEEKIAKAEIYRELGNFEAALLVLSEISETDRDYYKAAKIKALCNDRDKKLRQIGTVNIF